MLQVHHTFSPFRGTLTLPGDKSISHRAALLGALSDGACEITGFLESGDSLATLYALERLGITIEHHGTGHLVIYGRRGFLEKPQAPIYCGNSGTTMRLLAGLLATQLFSTQLLGDASLSKRPMQRIVEPLEAMGASLHAIGANNCSPLFIQGGPLRALSYTLPVASAQVKSALLLASLFAQGETTIVEPTLCRDHTERMLRAFQVECIDSYNAQGAHEIRLHGPQQLKACNLQIPGDISSAAFWMVAAAARPGSLLCLKKVGLNPTRTGVLKVLQRMGAKITINLTKEINQEPRGDIIVEGATLSGVLIEGEEIPNVIDELPILAIAGALAQGTTLIKDAQELRHKETDRLAALANNLRAMNASVNEHPDGLTICGGMPLQGAIIPSYGDHRIAMSFAIAGLFAEGKTRIENTECISTSYPGFELTLKQFEEL
ncbi:MAG: 3-phosphoshikimate 1-carboxyvinyltransferase [Chthoniobacterales bacterium]|nr:3-phosphoshikimate 1-carboxyvinyltransferase [Chthoniobacterales bacterium]